MPINIIGDAPPVERLETGLYSFDRAFRNKKNEIGFTLGKIVEVFGETHCGKSTTVYSLAGIIASSLKEDVGLADFEGFDQEFLKDVFENAGFTDGNIYYVLKDTDEEALDEIISLLTKKICVGIIDSVGAISPIAEAAGDIGDANMGQRAKIVAQFNRKALRILRNNEKKSVFLVNHAYPQIGGRGKISPGGEVKNYLASVRIFVKRRYWKNRWAEYPDGSYVIEGKVIKNRWGLKNETFYLFILAGKGIHKGLTAMYDGIMLGLVEHKRTISIGADSFGYLKDVIQKAQEGDDEFFEPFHEILYTNTVDLDKLEEEEEDEDTED